jgi:uncharacterized protein
MQLVDGRLRLAATDLANHLSCRHLTQLRLAVARGERQMPDWVDPRAHVLRERGFDHEERYVRELAERGLGVVRLSEEDGEEPVDLVSRTVEAMRSGDGVIVQGALSGELDGYHWYGRPDILRRVEVPGGTDFGSWGYEAVDTKLARETKGTTILQLTLYSELIGRVQRKTGPKWMHVVPPGEELAEESYEVARYVAYARFVRRRLVAALEGEETYPEPVEHCQICAFWQECDARRREDDHLSLVAGAALPQRKEMGAASRPTLAALGRKPLDAEWRPSRGSRETYEKLQRQARIQLEAREGRGPRHHELLDPAPGRGLARLPEPHPDDVFFDFEGDPFVGTAGLEYLWGWATLDGDGQPVYEHRWARDAEEEKAAFEEFVDLMIERLDRGPGFHIYHFAPYERSTLERLMGRYAVKEAEVDRLFRGEVLVDLHAVVRQGVVAAVEAYTLKDLEAVIGFEREADLRAAGRARGTLERGLEVGAPDGVEQEVWDLVLAYNRDDCLSTWRLRGWLEERRDGLLADGKEVPRPEPAEDKPDERLAAELEEVHALVERLTLDVPAEPSERTAEEQARWLLAQLLGYHRRESKVVWWEKFRLRELSDEELLEETAGIGRLRFLERVGGTDRCPLHRYGYPEQDLKIRTGSDAYHGLDRIGTIEAIDPRASTVDIKKMQRTRDVHPPALFAHRYINPDPKPAALRELARWILEHGVEGPGEHRAARDLLLVRPPRFVRGSRGLGSVRGDDIVEAAVRLTGELDHGVLAVQGPPGSGKTFTGGAVALDLVSAGRTVGVSAVGHQVIHNLLRTICEGARRGGGRPVKALHKNRDPEERHEDIREVDDYAPIEDAMHETPRPVLAGSAWLWARSHDPDLAESADVLLVDEAGQMSLADVLAACRGAKSLVLLGDPRQLEQPQQGSHPDGAHVSALEHLLAGEQTIPEGRGLFIKTTRRLAPAICSFTSALFYSDRLEALPELGNQRLDGPALRGAGLWYLPVPHQGNQSVSEEEVEAIVALVGRLTEGSTRWTNAQGGPAAVGLQDVLIVAPYNAQVQALKERLDPSARVGTVDKFQGQEAPIVIFSTATSSPDLAPRGMEFLYDPSRLNVATSRARCACVLVGSPALFEPECRTPRQMELANAFCRYLEVATTLAPAGSVSAPGRS